MFLTRLCFRHFGLVLLLHATAWGQKADKKSQPPVAAKPQTIKIAMRDGLRFDPPRFEGKPGADVVISLENLDSTDQMHNFVLVKPGKRDAIVNASLLLAEKGPALQFVPPGPEVLAASKLLAPEKKDSLRLSLPKEAGVYPFVCTFPGHGLVMYGAAYVGVKMPPLKQDKNIPATAAQTFIAGAGKRPFVQRIFMPDSGPAAIAIALPGDMNACWDAGPCRLRYVWKGEFIDATKSWAGSGKDLPKLGDKPFWIAAPDDITIRFGSADAAAPQAKFLGYTLDQGFPTFRYTFDGIEVKERIAVSKTGAVVREFKISQATGDVFVSVGSNPNGEGYAAWRSQTGKRDGGTLRLTPEEAAAFTLTLETIKQ
jgi:azurin